MASSTLNIEVPEIFRKTGENIRQRRESLGFSQEKLAQISNLTRASISELEAGKRTVNMTSLLEIANALGTSISELVREDDSASDAFNPRDIDAIIQALKLLKEELAQKSRMIHQLKLVPEVPADIYTLLVELSGGPGMPIKWDLLRGYLSGVLAAKKA